MSVALLELLLAYIGSIDLTSLRFEVDCSMGQLHFAGVGVVLYVNIAWPCALPVHCVAVALTFHYMLSPKHCCS